MTGTPQARLFRPFYCCILSFNQLPPIYCSATPLPTSSLMILLSFKQLQRDSYGSINTTCSPVWCKLSFCWRIIVWWAYLRFHAPLPTLPHYDCTLSDSNKPAVLSFSHRFMIPSSTHWRLYHIPTISCIYKTLYLPGNYAISCHWATSVFVSGGVSVFALFAHSQEMSPCKENSQFKLCVCHITENDWISKAADKKMGYICPDTLLFHIKTNTLPDVCSILALR